MKKNTLFLLAAFACVPTFADTPLGQSSNSTSLFACAVTSQKNPIPIDGKSTIYHTACRKVADQGLNPYKRNSSAYAPSNQGFGKIERTFFWNREANLEDGSEELINFCNSHLDYFTSCEWAELAAVDTDISEVAHLLPKEIKDIINQPTPSLTSDGIYGCAVILCLANPNGWASVGECKPPVKKLFRDLWKGRGWPSCS